MTGLHHRLRASSIPVLVYTAIDGDPDTATIQTFVNVPIGPASADRLVVVGIIATGSSRTLNSISIAGGAGTIVADTGADTCTAHIAQRLVTTGTTCDIAATFSADVSSCGIIVWVITKLNSTTALDGDAVALTTDPSLTLTTVPDAVVVAVASPNHLGSTTWSGGMIQDDLLNHDPISEVTGAHKYASGTSSGVSATTGVFGAAIAAAAWR